MSGFGAFANTQNTTPAAGTSIFGNTQQQPTTGIFGNTSQPANQPTTLLGNAGTNPQQNQPAPSPFGNTNTTGTTGGSIFGAANNPTQPAGTSGTSIFGNTPNTGGGMFGNAQTQQQTGTTPSLFGNTTAQSSTAGGGIFGNTQNQQQPQQQQPGTGTSVFGNTSATTTQPGTSGGLFGNTGTNTNQPATGGGLFGSTTNTTQPATGGGLFGSTTNTTQPATGGGLFGNTSNTTSQPATGGGLFGNASTNQPTTGLFGNTTGTTTQPTTSLFGSTATNTNNQQQQQQQQPSLFGNRPGGIFGSSTANTGTTGSGLFGSTQAQQQPQQQQQQQQQQPSLFGSTTVQPSSGLFGNTQTGMTGGSVFGYRTQQPTTGSLFGSTAGTGNAFNASNLPSSSLLGSRTTLTPAQQQADAQMQSLQLQQKIEAIYHAWNPTSPQCRFQYYFYNLVNPNQVSLYTRPANAKNDLLWEKALRENPDPTCHVPVLAIGFDDLRTRVEAQNKKSEEHQQHLKDLKSRLESLTTQHTLSNSSRLVKAAVAQTQLTQRLLKFVQHLHLLIPSVRSSSIRPEEEQLRSTLEEVEDELRRGRMKGKLNELWALLGAVNAAKERARTGTGEWAVVDEDGLAQLTQILSEQQAGLAHLTKILQKALKDVGIVLGTNTNSAESDYEVDNLLSSTSTFRASALR